ncbi:uncharacterized protein [Hyperolius riggenbachi]|uniref:uncharacterized protein n=1 Tax=Hyperolius riggenbachi TaxID=752182 RepID=UPI0035A2C97A
MSHCGPFFLLLLCQTLFLHGKCDLQVFAPSPQNFPLGSDIVLPCSFTVDDPSINPQLLAVLWLSQERELGRIDNKGAQFQPRMFVNQQNVVKGIASLEVRNVTISDIGRYTCVVIYTPNRKTTDVDLTVYATPSVTFEKFEKNDQSFVVCSMRDVYPKDVKADILKDAVIVEDSVVSEYLNPDGTYTINSTWNIPTDIKRKITSLSCLAKHATFPLPIQKDLRLVYEGESSNAGLVGGLVFLAVLMIIAAILGVHLYRKKAGSQKLTVTEIEGPVWRDGEKTSLSCKAIGCSKDVQVTWVIEGRGGTRVEVSEAPPRDGEAPPRDEEEAQPLMSREYEVTNEWTRNNHDLTTKLTFIPSISRHLGSTVTCKITHGKDTEERTYKPKSIYATPRLIEPFKFTLSDQGELKISGSFQRFHPREMEVSWTSRRGQSADKIQSQEEVTGNADGTFHLESNCTVSGELFKDPSYKVMVTWKHESMEKPQCREISGRDLPWRPKLQSIPIDSVFQGEEVLLQCRVSDFFPDALTVRWFEKKPGSQDLVDVSRSKEYTVQDILSQKTERNTFSTTATLSYKRSQLSEKGVDFICRVDHPSLEEPIQNNISQYRDTEPAGFIINNIHGPQTWYNEEKVTLYCTASYCMEDTQVVWMVKAEGDTVDDIKEEASDKRMDSGRSSGYAAHRERNDVSDKEGLQDIISSLTFTSSIAKHRSLIITCKITSGGKVKEKTFQPKYMYAKPKVSNPIKLSLTDSGEVICSLEIEEFYPSDVLTRWNDGDTTGSIKLSKNTDGTYNVHSDYKLPASFFQQEDSTVRVGWKHESMEKWESRQLSVRDKEFPWKPEVKDIVVPNLLIGSTATLRCEVSNVFPDVLTVKWLKKEKDSEELFPVIHGEKYNISELRPEKQKDNTFTYKASLKFQPSISTEERAEFICRVEHPALERAAEMSTGPLTITDIKVPSPQKAPSPQKDPSPQKAPSPQKDPSPQKGTVDSPSEATEEVTTDDVIAAPPPSDEPRFIVGEIKGPCRWFHGEKVTLYCSVSECSADTQVFWKVEETNGKTTEIISTGKDLISGSGYTTSKEMDESDKGLYNMTTMLTLVPSVARHLGVIISCNITSNKETTTQKFQPKSISGKLQVLEPVKTKLADGGNVLCTLSLQNLYPKQVKVTWTSGGEQLKSTEEYTENSDKKTYNGQSHCTVPGKLLLDPSFTLSVTCSHKSLEKPLSQDLTWRDKAFAWYPEIEAVPISRVLMDRWTTVQYNISRYFPGAVAVSWYRRERGGRECVPLPDNKEKYQIEDITHQRQQDHTYSCTARLRFKPLPKDQESEIICRVAHPSLKAPIEKSSGPLHVQAKPKVKKPVKKILGKGEVIFTHLLENFHPKQMEINWHCGTGEQLTQSCQSQETYRPNMDRTFSVTSVCRVPDNLLHSPDSRVRVTWRHESMDDPEYRELSVGNKASEQHPPAVQNEYYAMNCQDLPVIQAPESHHYRPQDIHNVMGHQHPSDTAPEHFHLPSQEVNNMVDLQQHCTNVPAPEFHHLSPQVVVNLEDLQQHHPSVPAPEFHHPSPQVVVNLEDLQQHRPSVPAPEFHHPSPQVVVNLEDLQQHRPSVPAPEFHHPSPQVGFNLEDVQLHNSSVPAPEFPHLHPHGIQPHYEVPEPQLHHPTPQYIPNCMNHQQHPTQETLHLLQQYIMEQHPHHFNNPAEESPHSSPQDHEMIDCSEAPQTHFVDSADGDSMDTS